jgi:hypothetical protein
MKTLLQRAIRNSRLRIVQSVGELRVYGGSEPTCKMPNSVNRHFTGRA